MFNPKHYDQMPQKSLFILTIFLLFTNVTHCQNLDIELLRNINLQRNTSLDGTFKAISNSTPYICIGIPTGMLGIGLLKKDSNLVRKAIVIGASVVTSAIITQAIKYSVNRPRPFETYPDIQKLSDGGSPSFPSGHTSEAFSMATSLSLECPEWYIIAPSYAWATTVAYSRMDLGVHYPSDILMGAVVGAGSAWLCHYLNKKLFRKTKLLRW